MDIIKAIMGLLLGLLFLGLILRIAYPILVFVGILFLFTVLRSMFTARTYQSNQRESYQRPNNQQQTKSRSNSDVIDAEYTEEEVD